MSTSPSARPSHADRPGADSPGADSPGADSPGADTPTAAGHRAGRRRAVPRKGAWVAKCSERTEQPELGRVRGTFTLDGEDYLNVVLIAPSGAVLGRVSPSEGGPTTFEPALPASDWIEIIEPSLPLTNPGHQRLYCWAHLLRVKADGRRLSEYMDRLGGA